MMLMVTVNALLFHFMPRFSRPDILFAVTVSEAFVAARAAALVFRYRAIVWIGAAAALAISSASSSDSARLRIGAMLMMVRGRQHGGRSGGVAAGTSEGAARTRSHLPRARRLARPA
jgi:hypothetical protein